MKCPGKTMTASPIVNGRESRLYQNLLSYTNEHDSAFRLYDNARSIFRSKEFHSNLLSIPEDRKSLIVDENGEPRVWFVPITYQEEIRRNGYVSLNSNEFNKRKLPMIPVVVSTSSFKLTDKRTYLGASAHFTTDKNILMYSSDAIIPLDANITSKQATESRGKNKTRRFIDKMMDRVKAISPDFRVEYFNGDGNHYVSNGVVYLNYDKLSPLAFVHELGHLWIEMFSRTNPTEFAKLIGELEESLKDTKLYKKVRAKYSDYNNHDFAIELMNALLQHRIMDAYMMNEAGKNGKIAKAIQNVKNAVARVLRYLLGNDVAIDSMVSGTVLKHISKRVADVISGNANGEMLHIYSDMGTYEYREGKINSMNEFYKSLMEGESEFVNLPTEDKVKVVYNRVKVSGGKKIVLVNGQMLTFELNATEQEIKNSIREIVSKDAHAYDKEIKSIIVDGIRKIPKGSNLHEKVSSLLQTLKSKNIPATYSMVKELITHMGIEGDVDVMRLSELNNYMSSNGIVIKEIIPESLIGFDPIVVVYSRVTVDGKKTMFLSLYDITPESLHYFDTEKGTSLFANIISNVKEKFSLRNKKVDARKLALTIIQNRLMRNGVIVLDSYVTGFYPSQYDNGKIAPNLVNVVAVNRDIGKLFKIKEFIDKIEDSELKKEFDSENHVNAQRGIVDLLFSYLQEKLNNQSYKGYSLNDEVNKVETLKAIIKLKMNEYRNNPKGSDITYYEYNLMAKVLVELNSLQSASNTVNEGTDMSQVSEKIKPVFSIKNDMLQSVVRNVRETIYRLGHIMDKWNETFNSIYDVYNKHYGQNFLKKAVFSLGSELFEKGFAVVKVKKNDGTYVEKKINYLLWTTDTNEDPFYANQAKNLPKEILDANRKIVDYITELLIDTIYEDRINRVGKMVKEGQSYREYTKEDAKKKLFESGYRKGFMPVLSKSPGETLRSVGIKESIQRYIDKNRNASLLFEEAAKDELTDFMDKELSVQLLDAFRGTQSGEYGPDSLLSRIGMKYDPIHNELVMIDESKANSMSTNLELITKYTTLAANRKILFEKNVIPLVNAVRFLLDNGANANEMTKEELTFLEEYIKSVVFNEGKVLTGKVFGQQVEPVIASAMNAIGTTLLAYNINVAAGSALYNASALFSEALTHTFSKLVGEKPPFSISTAVKAFTTVVTNLTKAMMIAQKLKLVNSSESDMISHQFNLKTKTSWISQYGANIGNWITDVHSRLTTMTAIMMEEGSWDAYSVENGMLKYDWKKDARWKSSDGKLILEKVKSELVRSGVMQSVNDQMPIGHDFNTSMSIKTISDKYILAAYDKEVRAQINNQILGRAFSMFKQFIYTRIDNAFASGGYLDSVGSWKVVKDKDGKEIVEWERKWVEGYLVSLFNAVVEVKKAGSIEGWNNLRPEQRENVRRAAARVIMFMILYALYNGIVDDDEDPDDIGVTRDRRIIKNIKYAYSEFLVISPSFWVRLTAQPFAVTSIINRIFDDKFGGTPFGRFLNAFVPGYNTVRTIFETFKSDNTLEYEDYLKRKEAAKKANETKAKRKASGYYDGTYEDRE